MTEAELQAIRNRWKRASTPSVISDRFDDADNEIQDAYEKASVEFYDNAFEDMGFLLDEVARLQAEVFAAQCDFSQDCALSKSGTGWIERPGRIGQ